MSKKLIAVASAAALALSALVAAPASSVGIFGATIDGENSGDGIAATSALLIHVPTEDAIRWVTTRTDNTAMEFAIVTPTETAAVTVTTTGGVKALSKLTASPADTHKTGVSSLTVNAANGTVKVYVYSTSTTAGTVTFTSAGNSLVYYVKGVSAKGYKIDFAGPASASQGVKYVLKGTVTDMYGNPTVDLTATEFTTAGLGAFAASPNETVVQSSTKGTYTITIPAVDVTAAGAGLLTLTLVAGSLYDENEDAFGKDLETQAFSLSSITPEVQIASLTAQVAALQATIADMRTKARSVTKKKYNTLARKWNAANPSARVALKK